MKKLMRLWVRFVGCMLLPLVLSGCMWGRMRINDPSVADRARMIRPGVTRGDQIVDIIGAQPTMRMPGKEQTLFGYTYGDKGKSFVNVYFGIGCHLKV